MFLPGWAEWQMLHCDLNTTSPAAASAARAACAVPITINTLNAVSIRGRFAIRLRSASRLIVAVLASSMHTMTAPQSLSMRTFTQYMPPGAVFRLFPGSADGGRSVPIGALQAPARRPICFPAGRSRYSRSNPGTAGVRRGNQSRPERSVGDQPIVPAASG